MKKVLTNGNGGSILIKLLPRGGGEDVYKRQGQFDRIGIILVVDADAKHVEIVPVICKKIGGTADAGTNLIYFQDFVALEHFVQSG